MCSTVSTRSGESSDYESDWEGEINAKGEVCRIIQSRINHEYYQMQVFYVSPIDEKELSNFNSSKNEDDDTLNSRKEDKKGNKFS